MGDVLQIVGSILLLVVGVAVILYVLFRKSPVKTADSETIEENADEGDGTVDDADDIPEGETPAEIARDDEEREENDAE